VSCIKNLIIQREAMIFAKAVKSYQSGNFEQAADICKEIIKGCPDHAEALYLLGLIHAQAKHYDTAVEYIKRALQIKPDFADAYNNLGIIRRLQGKLDEAIRNFLKAVDLKPDFSHALYNLGSAYQVKGNIDSALSYYQKVISIEPNQGRTLYSIGIIKQMKGLNDEAAVYYLKAIESCPDFADAYFSLGGIFHAKGRINEAISYYQKAIEYNPFHAEAYNNLGVIFQGQEEFENAVTNLKRAIALNPHFAEAYNNLGNTYKDFGDGNHAIENYLRAVEIKPDYVLAHYNLGNILDYQGMHAEAMKAYDRAIEYKPEFITARWARCVACLPIIYPDQQSIHISREEYNGELVKLWNTIPLETHQEVEAAAEAVGSHQPFLLACQGFNDKGLQEVYGSLACTIMAKRYPQFAMSLKVNPEKPLRVGIVSAYFHHHSIWKIPLRGWIENLDAKRFDLFGYHTGRIKDGATESARKHSRKFIEDVFSFEELCQVIRNDQLHILIYPEIGMDRMTLRLASLRLAPVQCASLGHPDTTGLPTIDYYLSSDLMEPPDGDEHYTEQLIRLPNLGFAYTPPSVPYQEVSRESLGLRKNSILYLCSHALFTYLPRYDDVFPRIAGQAGDCQFLFIAHQDEKSPVTVQFRERLKAAFHRFNIPDKTHVVFLPPLSFAHYHAVNTISDIFLDSMGWSANNSTFEAIACNLPVITMPGSLMRQRHCAGILTMMGVTDTIASSPDEYVDMAVRLGKDAARRAEISRKIAAQKHRLYNDKTCIMGLEDFLEKAIKEKA
jgi:protein O-GlcNAc transferase